MDYYSYINQRQPTHGRHSSAVDFTAGDTGIDVACSPFSLGAAGRASERARYPDTGVLAHCGTSTFTDGQQHRAARLDGSAIANGNLSPGRESASYGRPFTTSVSAQNASSATDVDALTYGGTQRTATTVNNHQAELNSIPLHARHQPQRLRYLPPPAGTVLPTLDAVDDDDAEAVTEENDDEAAASLGDGRSSASSTQSSTSDCRQPAASAPGDIQRPMNSDSKDSTTAVKSDKTSITNTAAAGLTSAQPLIYPWMRRVHSSNNGMRSLRIYHHEDTVKMCK